VTASCSAANWIWEVDANQSGFDNNSIVYLEKLSVMTDERPNATSRMASQRRCARCRY
jgi:hypothetical protein